MDYNQWRAWLLKNGHTVQFGELMGTPLVLATEQQINIYLSWKGIQDDPTMGPLAE